MEHHEVIERIDTLKSEIEKLRPISHETEQRIFQKFRLDWNFHSNNLEGNSLTFGETKSFLLHGITAEGKPLKDHLDLKGHNEAILLLDEVVKQNRPLTETFIRELHEIILHEPYEKPAITPDGLPTTKKIEIGQYKKTPNHVKTATGETFYFASPEETPALMNDLMDWYENSLKNPSIHPLTLAAQFHYKFIRIHPFDDGNGRIARILMNLIIMTHGFPPVIIKTGDKANYFKALQQADGGDEEPFEIYIGEQLIISVELFLKGAKGEEIEEPDDVDKKIALLKTKLKEESVKIILDNTTLKGIINDSLFPLLDAIFLKLHQFDEFFHSNSIVLFEETDNARKTHLGTKNKIDSLKPIISENFVNTRTTYLEFQLHWNHFIKTDEKLFDINLRFVIQFAKFEMGVVIGSTIEEMNKHERVNILYNKKNDVKKFQKVAALLANIVLSHIEKKLEG